MLDHRDLPLLAVLDAVVRAGSITAAARQLGVAKSVVSHQLRQLEERCGARLVERTPRHLRLTQVGERIQERARRVVSELDEVRRVAEAQRSGVDGVLRVAAPIELGRRYVGPVVAALCAVHPQLGAELRFEDGPAIDLVEHGLDAAVRVGALVGGASVVVRKLAEDVEIAVAAPSLARELQLARPRDLARAPWVAHRPLADVPARFRDAAGAVEEGVLRPPRVVVSDAEGLRTMARAGIGVVFLPSLLVVDELRAGVLERVMPGWIRREVGIHLVRPSRRHPPARVSHFVDAVTAAFVGLETVRDVRG